jgi:hypothetical protein
LRISEVSEREICHWLGCTMERVRAVLDESAARMFAPGIGAPSASNLATFDALERAWAAGDGWRPGSKAVLRQICRKPAAAQDGQFRGRHRRAETPVLE